MRTRLTALLSFMIRALSVPVLLTGLIIFSGVSNKLQAQNILDQPVTLSVRQVPLRTVLKEVQEQTGVKFMYSSKVIRTQRKITCNLHQQKLSRFLEDVVKPLDIGYQLVQGDVLLYFHKNRHSVSKELPSADTLSLAGGIKGLVKSNTEDALAGIIVEMVGGKATTTDNSGHYRFKKLPAGRYLLRLTSLGYRTIEQEVVVGDSIVVADVILTENTLNLEEVVVTGFVDRRRKLESSVAITTYSSKRIHQLAPVSTADLLRRVPGFQVETSAGEAGNNLFARGLPSAGSYEYVQVQEDGMPVFEDGALQYANADNWFRIDETIHKLEAVRGGSGSIFASNAPGGLINFISKTGGSQFTGTARLTTGTSGLFRTDLNLGGPLLKDKLFFNIGGFYRIDNGIRHPGFKANVGGQLKLNLKYDLDQSKGYIKLYFKRLNDRNLFLLPVPLTGKDHPKGITGFNPNYGTLTSVNFSRLSVPQYEGGYYRRNLENGAHPDVTVTGAELKITLGAGLSMSHRVRLTTIDLAYTAIYPGAVPQTPSDFAASYTTASGASFPVNNPLYSYVATGAPANPALVAKLGYWAVDKQMHNFANNLRFDYRTGPAHLSIGYYYSGWSSEQQWNWSNLLVEITDHPQLLNLVDGSLAPSAQNASRTYHGVTDISWLTRQTQLKGAVNALFAHAEMTVAERLTLDGGLRYDMDRYKGYLGNSQLFAHNLDNHTGFDYDFTTTTADNSITTTGAPFYYWKYGINRLSLSVAANYKFSPRMAAYLRYSNGFRSPVEEVFYDHARNLEKIRPASVTQYELGYKLQARNYALLANLFYMNMQQVAFTDILVNGTSENSFARSRNIGLELEAEVTAGPLSVNLSATIQDPEFNSFKGSGFNYEGNRVRRISAFYGTVRPVWQIAKNLLVYMETDIFGKRYSDNANRFVLPAYSVLNAGAALTLGKLRFAIDATNLTNAVGLTEGNPRITTEPGAIYYARPIFGRFARASVTLEF